MVNGTVTPIGPVAKPEPEMGAKLNAGMHELCNRPGVTFGIAAFMDIEDRIWNTVGGNIDALTRDDLHGLARSLGKIQRHLIDESRLRS